MQGWPNTASPREDQPDHCALDSIPVVQWTEQWTEQPPSMRPVAGPNPAVGAIDCLWPPAYLGGPAASTLAARLLGLRSHAARRATGHSINVADRVVPPFGSGMKATA